MSKTRGACDLPAGRQAQADVIRDFGLHTEQHPRLWKRRARTIIPADVG